MNRCLAATLGLLCMLSFSFADGGPGKLTIGWHGQSFFDITTTKGTRIAIDPHAIEAYGRTDVSADLVLISHLHNDHTQVDVIKNGSSARVLSGIKVNGKKAEWNPINETFRDVQVRSVGTFHDNMQGMQRGKNTIFVLELDGLRIVHLGDLGHILSDNDVKKIGPVDVLMIPVGGVYTLNGSEAKKVVEQLKPKLFILPMHYGTKVFDDVLPADEFLDEQTNVRKLATNRLEIDPEAKQPAPMIVLLNWQEAKSR